MREHLALARCARCGFPAPIEDEEMTGPTIGSDPDCDSDLKNDPSLPVVVVPPPGWLTDPDGEGIIHHRCATVEEREDYNAEVAEADRGGQLDPATAERARLVFGVDPEDDD